MSKPSKLAPDLLLPTSKVPTWRADRRDMNERERALATAIMDYLHTLNDTGSPLAWHMSRGLAEDLARHLSKRGTP